MIFINFIKRNLAFLVVFAIFSSAYYLPIITKGPLNAHMWRQTDCLSLAHHYMEGAAFLRPEMHLQFGDDYTSGLSAGEFPILYYMIGNLWKVFGESYFIYRLVCLIILFLGLFALYKSLEILIKDKFWSVVISALLFTSPVYVIYGVSFLTDVPAFSFVLIALYFILKYFKDKSLWKFFLSMMFFALAGLLKTSSMIAFVFLFFILFIESFSIKTFFNQKLFSCKIFEWIGFTSVVGVVFSWYLYAEYYNSIHGFKYTFNNIYPIWKIKKGEISELIKGVNNFTSYVYFSTAILFALLFIGAFNIFNRKAISLFAYLANMIVTIGCLIYFILWGPLMGIHDYYYSSLLILFIGIIIPFVVFIKSGYPQIFNGKKTKVFLLLLLSYNFIYCISLAKLKTTSKEGNFVVVRNHEFIKLMQWTNWDVESNWYRFVSMKPYIRQIGIKPEDKIISLPDPSFNVSLYLINQKGWTNFSNYSDSKEIEKLIAKGAKYLFVSDPVYLEKEFLAPFLFNKIGDYQGIGIFRL